MQSRRESWPRRYQVQTSSFLNLPGEIRNEIYRIALIISTPIDLCPAKYLFDIEDFQEDPMLMQRYLAFTEGDHEDENWMFGHRPTKLTIRLQPSLEGMRRNLAINLSAVCRQVYHEAARYLRSKNTFVFSDDEDWFIVLKFLMTIGPNARSMIENIRVLPPSARRINDVWPMGAMWHVKHHPKLRLEKLWREAYLYHDIVWNLWISERTLRTLTFIVPDEYHSDNPYYPRDTDVELLAKVTFIVHAGGTIYHLEDRLSQSWDVVVLPGGQVFDSFGGEQELKYDHLHKWKSDLDYLTGINQLFEIDEISIHSNGGRARPQRDVRRVTQVLKAFGPCMIVAEEVPHVPTMVARAGRLQLKSTVQPSTYTRYTSLIDLRDGTATA